MVIWLMNWRIKIADAIQDDIKNKMFQKIAIK